MEPDQIQGGAVRVLSILAVTGLFFSSCAVAEDARMDGNDVPIIGSNQPTRNTAPRFEIVPDDHAVEASSRHAPVLDSVTYRVWVRSPKGMVFDIVPDFHFHAPNGNAIMLRRELVETNGPFAQTQIPNASINIPPEGQKAGAVVTGGWRCGMGVYHITMRATILDADGNHSNSITYTIHCNGG